METLYLHSKHFGGQLLLLTARMAGDTGWREEQKGGAQLRGSGAADLLARSVQEAELAQGQQGPGGDGEDNRRWQGRSGTTSWPGTQAALSRGAYAGLSSVGILVPGR